MSAPASTEPHTAVSGTSPGLSLGRWWGVPVRLSWSWLLIVAGIVAVFGPPLQRAEPSLGAGAFAVAGGYALILAVSVLVHELAHALVGRWHGHAAQEIVLTLWGGHTQFTRPAATPSGSAWTAAGGPAANLALAGLAAGLQALLDPGGVAGLLLGMTVTANVLLAVFNILPGLPLDGGRLVEAGVWAQTGDRHRGTEAAGWSGRVIAVACIAAVAVPGLLGLAGLSIPVTVLAIAVGFMLFRGATEAVAAGRWGRRARQLRRDQLLLPATAVPGGSTVADAAQLAQRTGGAVVLLEHSRPVGVVDLSAAERVPAALQAATPAAAIATAVPRHAVLEESTLPASGAELIHRLAEHDAAVWVLLTGGTVSGVIPRHAVFEALRRHGLYTTHTKETRS
ncbi:MAG: peptidase [Micrococcus sp.]|nr:peptidase [Micrococcus sp.]